MEYTLATNSQAMMEFYESWIRKHVNSGWKSASFAMGKTYFFDLLKQYPPELIMNAINYYTEEFPEKNESMMEISGRPILSFPEVYHFKLSYDRIRREMLPLLPAMNRTAKNDVGAKWSPVFPILEAQPSPKESPPAERTISAFQEPSPESRPENRFHSENLGQP